MSQTPAGLHQVRLEVGIGNLKPVPFMFDTGSSGLRVYPSMKLDAPGSGVRCTETPTSVTYGNPGRITLTGVICYATMSIGGAVTAEPVPFAYLKTAACAEATPNCRLPDVNDAHSNAAGESYGVFGAGIVGPISAKDSALPPLLALPGSYGRTFDIVLAPQRGELILGSVVPTHAAAFPLRRAAPGNDAKWVKGNACLYVNQQPIGTCLTVAFDSGNGSTWIHNVSNPRLPAPGGLVAPGTRVGFGPEGGKEALTVVAGTGLVERIRAEQVPSNKAPITNTGIEVFFHHVVTYDTVHGVIYFAPAAAQPADLP